MPMPIHHRGSGSIDDKTLYAVAIVLVFIFVVSIASSLFLWKRNGMKDKYGQKVSIWSAMFSDAPAGFAVTNFLAGVALIAVVFLGLVHLVASFL